MVAKAPPKTAPKKAVAPKTARIIREAPAVEPLHTQVDPAFPPAPNEPVLAIDEIQGNILGGFNKDFQTLVFLKVTNTRDFKGWLREILPSIATSAEVVAFNRLFKAMRARRQREGLLKVTWANIVFSFAALQQLAPEADLNFTDAAFTAGLAKRSTELGDPVDPAAEGHVTNWLIGGPDNEAHVVLIVASDSADDLQDEVAHLLSGLRGGKEIFRQEGRTLSGDLRGHEQFGFLDGVSQPGIRGRLSEEPTDLLTPRQNPNNRDQGKPGQDVLWPGEFVFGYPTQDPDATSIAAPGPLSVAGPEWATNGAFLVFRRLRQDVGAFHAFLHAQAQLHHIAADELGAKLVGRWQSGAPVMRTPGVNGQPPLDNPALANDDCANNNFEFHDASHPIPRAGWKSAFDCIDAHFPVAPADVNGTLCPVGAHIRKAYPRDDERPPFLAEVSTQTHRLLRRGIPFGVQSASTIANPIPDDDHTRQHGLLFLAYQTSIVDQFEFVTKNWVNNPNFREDGTGQDPIIGQNADPAGQRVRSFAFGPAPEQRIDQVQTEWVIPTGGGYFFCPSLHALRHVLTR